MAGKIGGQSGNDLNLLQHTRCVLEGGDCVVEFADDIKKLARRRESQMARPCTACHRDKRSCAGRKLARCRVEIRTCHLVGAQIGDERAAIVWRQHNVMGMRSALTILVRAVPTVLHQRGAWGPMLPSVRSDHVETVPAL